MPASDDCGGCGKQIDVEKPVYPHERYGLLCAGCHRFATMCEVEVAKMLQFAECLAVLETLMTRDAKARVN